MRIRILVAKAYSLDWEVLEDGAIERHLGLK
jgi:hypothetical protein